jgi:hypothetical protein
LMIKFCFYAWSETDKKNQHQLFDMLACASRT